MKLKTSIKCRDLLTVPIKGRTQCYGSLHSKYKYFCEVLMHVTVALGRPYYTHYQYTTNTCSCVEPPHFLAWFLTCFANVIKTLLHAFGPNETFYLSCKCSTSYVAVCIAMDWDIWGVFSVNKSFNQSIIGANHFFLLYPPYFTLLQNSHLCNQKNVNVWFASFVDKHINVLVNGLPYKIQ